MGQPYGSMDLSKGAQSGMLALLDLKRGAEEEALGPARHAQHRQHAGQHGTYQGNPGDAGGFPGRAL